MTTAAPIHYQKYNVNFEVYAPGQAQWIPSDCNEICFVNTGTSNVTINNAVLLQPQNFLTISGNDGELDITKYTYMFSGAGINQLTVIKKTYQ